MAVANVALIPTPRPSDEELLIAFPRDGQRWPRDEMIERSVPLARKLALRYRHTEEPLVEYRQWPTVM